MRYAAAQIARTFRAAAVVALTSGLAYPLAAQSPALPRLLVFSKTAGYRHASIESGVVAIRSLGTSNGFAVDATEDAATFTDRQLRRYRAVVFLNTTGDVLTPVQEQAFERFVQAGGGYVGIHSATDTEYRWPWYGQLAGAYFNGHPNAPNVRRGAFRIRDSSHVSTRGLPPRWERDDEFYNFKQIASSIRVLVDIDETSYEGGTNGANHPMSWYHEFDGGRAWYTNMGHTESTFAEPLFLQHLLGGIRYAMGGPPRDYRRARPAEDRFSKVVLAERLNEPTELAVLPDERVLFIERKGAIQLYSPFTGKIRQVGFIDVNLTYLNGARAEDGLLGLAIDPAFATNGWIYLFYSKAGPDFVNVLARYTMHGDSVDTANPVTMLEVPVQREQCCHTGGSLAFDAQGNLFISTGDNTNPFATGYAPIDERPGRMSWDAQKSSANTNDLRGKILRIHPERDGGYTIPPGNLFPPGTPRTRPEIYTMGHRNPYRISVDKRSGVLYWGDVGPDASVDSAARGPAGHDEVGRAARPGNYGWPHFVGDNKAYRDVDWATMQVRAPFDAARPINDSPNNTGLTELPPAQKAFIWYPYGPSPDFPLAGDGGRTAMAGPVFHGGDFAGAARPFPPWYEGRLFIYEWMRGWIMAVSMDSAGSFASMERFLPSQKFANPVDMEFGPNGDLYVLEYGTTWFKGNDDARLVRIEYHAGNRAPVAVARADRTMGALPLRVTLDGGDSDDADGDSLRFAWTIAQSNGLVVRRLTGARPVLPLTASGSYVATLTVTDPQGARGSAPVYLTAGNEPPRVTITVDEGNSTFFWPGVPIRYAVGVTDREDGSLQGGRISAQRVRVTAEHGADMPKLVDRLGAGPGGAAGAFVDGRALIEGSDCLSCHKVDEASIGPAYRAVATRYATDSGALPRLAAKIRSGGSGIWGRVMMPAHTTLSGADARRMASYILSLARRDSSRATALPVRGSYRPHDSLNATLGTVALRASYTDRGGNGRLGVTAETTLVLRAPILRPEDAELTPGAAYLEPTEQRPAMIVGSTDGAWMRFPRLDLTGVDGVVIGVVAHAGINAMGGAIELRFDSATGPVVAATEMIDRAADGTVRPLRLALAAPRGVHDLYLVFRSPGATGERPLLGVVDVRVEAARREQSR